MKLQLVLLLLVTISTLTSWAHEDHENREKRQASPGPPAKNLLQATLNTFAAAVATENKKLILKVFHWPNPNETRINRAIASYRGVTFQVQSASYMGTQRIEGVSNTRIGNTDKTQNIVIKYDPKSPTNWKIMSVRPINVVNG